MKLSKWLAILLTLCMALSLLPAAALAEEDEARAEDLAAEYDGIAENEGDSEENDEASALEHSEQEAFYPEGTEPVEDALPLETDGEEDVHEYTYTWINPDIDGVVVLREPDAKGTQRNRGVTPAFSDLDSAGAYIRSQYKVRAEKIEYSYTFDNGFSWDAVQEAVDKALEHTGVPTEGDYILKHLCGNGYSVSVSGNTYTITITPTYYTTADQEAAVDAAVADVLSQLDLGALSTYEKVKAIHDFIVQNAEYDNENLNDQTYTLKYTAYAALINHTAVCQGYALLTYRLMLEAGIDCRIVTGQAGGGGHAWNIVKLGGYYYYLDCTWDDPVFADPSTKPEDYVRYDYFLKNGFADHQLNEAFTSDEFNSAYPIGPEDYQPESRPTFETQALLLSGQIGVAFYMDLPAIDGVSYEGSYMTFAIDHGPISDPVYYDSNNRNRSGELFSFMCYVNAIQMAEPITATFHYGDGQEVSKTYAVKDYFTSFDETVTANPNAFDAMTQELVKALADYGHYAQPFLSDARGWEIGTAYAEMDKWYYNNDYPIDTVKQKVAGKAITRNIGNDSVLTSIKYSLTLDSETAINVYFTPAPGFNGDLTFTVSSDAAMTVTKSGGEYRVKITGISAHKLGDEYIVTAKTADNTEVAYVKVSALSYVQGLLEAEAYKGDTNAQNAAAALYYYYYYADQVKRNQSDQNT